MGWGSSTRRGGGRKLRARPRNFVFLGFRREESGMSREFCRDVPDPWRCSKSLCKKNFVRIFRSLVFFFRFFFLRILPFFFSRLHFCLIFAVFFGFRFFFSFSCVFFSFSSVSSSEDKKTGRHRSRDPFCGTPLSPS